MGIYDRNTYDSDAVFNSVIERTRKAIANIRRSLNRDMVISIKQTKTIKTIYVVDAIYRDVIICAIIDVPKNSFTGEFTIGIEKDALLTEEFIASKLLEYSNSAVYINTITSKENR